MGYSLCKCPKLLVNCKKCHSTPVKYPTSVLVILLSRIGLDVPHNEYREVVMKILDLKQFVGMIGGKPKRALFFLGHEGRKELIYLDPHYVQNSVNRMNLETEKNTFFCDSYRTVDYKSLDPSLGFGFLIKDINDLEDFHAYMSNIAAIHKE
jgi:cysteine protease ATG4